MGTIGLFAALFFVAAVAPSQEPGVRAQPADVKPGELCTVEGQVVKSTTGEGLKKITVRVQSVGGGDQQMRSAITDAGILGCSANNARTRGSYSPNADAR